VRKPSLALGRRVSGFLVLLGATLPGSPLLAAHPLITEDTGTQGEGRFQLELANEHTSSRQGGFEQYTVLTNTLLTYGLTASTDVILSLPYLRLGASSLSGKPGADGFTDSGLDVKWRFYEEGRLSMAVKPGVTFPTGDEDRGLGTGKYTWSLYTVASYNPAPWTFHLHLGHLHHNNTFNERVDIWHASAAVAREMSDTLRLILDTGIDTNTDTAAHSHPAFMIAGLIWTPGKDVDLDLGYKLVSDDRARSRALLAGLTLRW
jgi:hypothetical protein